MIRHATILSLALLAVMATAGIAHSKPVSRTAQAIVTCDQRGCSDWYQARHTERAAPRRKSHKSRRSVPVDANGNSIVRSRSGIVVRVSPRARAALQCIVDHVEASGVRIKSMRGYGPGTVRGSLHPSGRALDINQTDRDVTHPAVPRSVSNDAADSCGVISGARWGYADNGHWNLAVHGRVTQEPWPRVVQHNKAVLQ